MEEHAESESHIHACQVETSSAVALLRGFIAQQLQQVQESERLKTGQYITHTTNFSHLIDLVVSCEGGNLRSFLRKQEECIIHIKGCCIETISLWVEKCLLKLLHQAHYLSLLADEYTDVSTIE